MIGDLVAKFFAEKEIRHVFTVSGAGNIRILDAIARLGKTELICCHHEQACAQAAIGYYRVSGKIAPVVVTCGGGAANVVTGIVSAWMDSIPLFVIAGQESRRNDKLRAYGVQGFDLSKMCEKVSKLTILLENAGWKDVLWNAYDWALMVRPGPVVIEVPMDIQ